MLNLLAWKQTITVTFLTIAGLGVASPSMAVSLYTITDLGSLSPQGTDTRAAGINNLGQVVGRSRFSSGTLSHGYIWENGVLSELPYTGLKNGTEIVTLPGRGGFSRSINDSGFIVGTADELPGPTDRGLLWSPNGSGGYNLAIYDFGGVESYFYDINNSNQIAGAHIYASGKRNAVFWENNLKIDLPSLGGDENFTSAINDNTVIAGYIDTDGADNGTNTYEAAIWQKDSNGNFVLSRLGTFGAAQSLAKDININNDLVGQLVNVEEDVTTRSPFLFKDGNKIDLGSFGGTVGDALSINANTQIVGYSNTGSNVAHAFLWENGQLFDLNNLLVNGSGWQLTQATGINDLGQIVGYGLFTDANGVTQTRAFILEAVPEPFTILGVTTAVGFGMQFKNG